MKNVFLVIFSLLSTQLYSQNDDIIQIRIAQKDIIERNFIDLGFIFNMDGKVSQTQGYLNGAIRWSRVHLQTQPKLPFFDGRLYLNHDSLANNDYKIQFEVSYTFGAKHFIASFIYEFPKLIDIELMSNSIFTQGTNFLVVKGTFSNGLNRVINPRVQYQGFKLNDFSIEKNEYISLQRGIFSVNETAHYFDSIYLNLCYRKRLCKWSPIDIEINNREEYIVRGKNGTIGNLKNDGNGTEGETPEPLIVLIFQKGDKFFYQVQMKDKVVNKIAGNNSRIEIGNIGGNGGNGIRMAGVCSEGVKRAQGGDAGNGGDVDIYFAGELDKIKSIFQIRSVGGSGGEGGFLQYCEKLPLGGLNGLSGDVSYFNMTDDTLEALKESFGL